MAAGAPAGIATPANAGPPAALPKDAESPASWMSPAPNDVSTASDIVTHKARPFGGRPTQS
eukprot:8447825-Pyramimonas_sp.AAC.1